jgi:hypothetical protein
MWPSPQSDWIGLKLQASLQELKANVFKQNWSRPVPKVNMDDPGEMFSAEELAEFMSDVIENAQVDALPAESGSCKIYDRCGFESVDKNIRSLILFKQNQE